MGANIGAGQPARARRIVLAGGGTALAGTNWSSPTAAVSCRGTGCACSADEQLLSTGAHYGIVGPFYGFFALGFSLAISLRGACRLLGRCWQVMRCRVSTWALARPCWPGPAPPSVFAAGAVAMGAVHGCV